MAMTRFTGRVAILAFCLSALSAPSRAQETCWSTGGMQFADNETYCVSSVLPPVQSNSYGPENLVFGSDGSRAWCEGVKGDGTGQTISIDIVRGSEFGRLVVVNGYAKSARTFSRNGRVRRFRVTTDKGVDRIVNLSDHGDMQPIALGMVAKHNRVELTILEVYPGSKYRDTCIGFLSPDFEQIERLNMENAAPPAPVEPAGPERVPAPPEAGFPAGKPGEGLGDLGFPDDGELELPRE